LGLDQLNLGGVSQSNRNGVEDGGTGKQKAQEQFITTPRGTRHHAPAMREVHLSKPTEDTKIGAVFHRSDDAFDKSFFNVGQGTVQPIIKKVDSGSMAEKCGLCSGDIVLTVNGIEGLSNFQVVEMLRKGHGMFNLMVISGRQIQRDLQASRAASALVAAAPPRPPMQ